METIQPAAIKPTIEIADLAKLDFRIGTILNAQPIEESDRLARLVVDFDDRRRTILAGLRQERDDLSSLEGLQTLFLVNLAPRKMFGYTSEGMLFDVGYEDGILPALLLPERKLPNGTRAG